MTRRIASTVLIAALVAATVHPNAAADVVALRIRGRCWTAPATVRITVVVEPNAANLYAPRRDGRRSTVSRQRADARGSRRQATARDSIRRRAIRTIQYSGDCALGT